MIEYTDTTVFNVNAQTIVNTINCIGIMGSGLALEFKLRFPEMYEDYVKRCEKKEVKIGKPYLYRNDPNLWVMNFPTKYHWKYPSKIEWIEQGLEYFVSNYKRGGITSIAFPKLGSSHGGLDWNEVKSVMEKYLKDVDIKIYICLDEKEQALGIEKLMVDILNNTKERGWVAELKINNRILTKIDESLPVNRFYKLKNIEGIGKQSYDKLFKFFYKKAQVNKSPNKPISHKESLKLNYKQMNQMELAF